ncbi:MAG: thiol-disulfide oxidoreductase DCC family protein [Pirellula sp.]|jgi:predicted DCC family thiol-disulfide oxidoreductase YuxK
MADVAIEKNKSVVLYDGHCNFCTAQVANLRRFDVFHRLEFVSLHEPAVAKLYPDLTHEQLMEQMWVIAPNGKRYAGAYSFRYLSCLLPMFWPLAPMLHFPGLMPLWSYLYREVAKRRYRIAGRNCDEGTCSIHAGHGKHGS